MYKQLVDSKLGNSTGLSIISRLTELSRIILKICDLQKRLKLQPTKNLCG